MILGRIALNLQVIVSAEYSAIFAFVELQQLRQQSLKLIQIHQLVYGKPTIVLKAKEGRNFLVSTLLANRSGGI
ncbi:hypothetical protein H6F89_00680 [Cyanobacteria bacterium FACHB-63]|nr:hypothetical protein [Cyanobacteria bacterium FACHB-63]